MAAVFTMRVTVNGEFLFAVLADQFIICLVFDLVQMAVPPPQPAFVRAETFMLPSRILPDCFTALFADGFFLHRFDSFDLVPSKPMPLAVRLYAVDGKIHLLGNLYIAEAGVPELCNLLFLFVFHCPLCLLMVNGLTPSDSYVAEKTKIPVKGKKTC